MNELIGDDIYSDLILDKIKEKIKIPICNLCENKQWIVFSNFNHGTVNLECNKCGHIILLDNKYY